MENKPAYLSKTLWVNVIVAILALAYPAGAEFVKGNESLVMAGFALVNIVLRLATKNGVQIG